MDIEELQTFVEVAEAGGVSAAARRLGVAKSVVSRSLIRVETALGVQLLARTSRGAALTEAGMAFHVHAARIVAEFDAARESILPAGEIRGRLRIAAPISFGPTHIAPAITMMAQRHPLLQIQTHYSDKIVDLVAEGYDCAVRIGHLDDSSLVARRVGSIHGKLVASPSYVKQHGEPRTPAELLSHRSLMQGAERWRFTDGENVITTHPQGTFKADNPVALCSAAVGGLGLGYLADHITDEHIRSGALVQVMAKYPPLPAGVFVVHAAGRNLVRKVRVLADLLAEVLKDGGSRKAA